MKAEHQSYKTFFNKQINIYLKKVLQYQTGGVSLIYQKRKDMLTALQIRETVAKIKGVTSFEVKNLDVENESFQIKGSVYKYELTPSKKLIKTGSVKYMFSASNFADHSY